VSPFSSGDQSDHAVEALVEFRRAGQFADEFEIFLKRFVASDRNNGDRFVFSRQATRARQHERHSHQGQQCFSHDEYS
jgi:hypothetical protein